MRERSYHLVGTNRMKQYRLTWGGVIIDLGLDSDLEGYARAKSDGSRTGCCGLTSRVWSFRRTY